MPLDALTLSEELIRCPSVTPTEGGALDLLQQRLEGLGFTCTRLVFTQDGTPDVDNLYARLGTAQPNFCFAGHTDVVPPGDPADWASDPFKPEIRDGRLYGRGASDMKCAIAAMVAGTDAFLADNGAPTGSISFLITGDEEGPSVNGTKKVLGWMEEQGEKIDACLVGEPTNVTVLGDMVKIGRRGSLNCTVTVRGTQGHVAYPHLARNPIHLAAPALAALAAEVWDEGNAFFPPTSFQISNIHSGTGATNVVPGELEALINFRFSTESTVEGLQQRVCDLLDAHGLEYELHWTVSGLPFLTEPGALLDGVSAAIRQVTGRETQPSTSGGTSDGRFIATMGTQVVELGPVNATIHQVNECIKADDLDLLTDIYQVTLERLLT